MVSDYNHRDRNATKHNKELRSHEIRTQLTSDQVKKQKAAMREIILSMSKGEDMRSFYTDVISGIHTSDLELKKLVCLYIVSYSQDEDDRAFTVVNALQTDAKSLDPLTRALAIKTMGGIRSENVIQDFFTILADRVKNDDDPYVRKCAVLCVAKFYAIAPKRVEASTLIQETVNCLDHANATVISNAIIALSEISQMAGRNVFPHIDSLKTKKLCASMPETTEWGQIVILDFLATLDVSSVSDAKNILEDITVSLNHTNSAVVLSAVKVYAVYSLKFDEIRVQHLSSIVNPLTGLLHAGPEMLYLILRNISLIVQEFPDLMVNEAMTFIASSSEPHSVRMEKIDIMTRLVTEENIDYVLAELNTYAQEADIEIVRKAITSIGKCALKVSSKANQCVSSIKNFIEKDPSNAIEVSIVVMKDIFRQYPQDYPAMISLFVEHMDSINESEAKAAMVWLLGEYSEYFANPADDLNANFVREFLDESHEVQLQILTAAVKIYIQNPVANKAMLEKLMNMVSDQCQNPDLRDRAFMYWRLIFSTDLETVKRIVCSKNPKLDSQTDGLDPKLRRELLRHMCTLASVYHKSPHTFLEDKSSLASSNVSKYDAVALENNDDSTQYPIASEEYFSGQTSSEAVGKMTSGDQTGFDFNQFSQAFATGSSTSFNSAFAENTNGTGMNDFFGGSSTISNMAYGGSADHNAPGLSPSMQIASDMNVSAFNQMNINDGRLTSVDFNFGSSMASSSYQPLSGPIVAPSGFGSPSSTQLGASSFGGHGDSLPSQSLFSQPTAQIHHSGAGGPSLTSDNQFGMFSFDSNQVVMGNSPSFMNSTGIQGSSGFTGAAFNSGFGSGQGFGGLGNSPADVASGSNDQLFSGYSSSTFNSGFNSNSFNSGGFGQSSSGFDQSRYNDGSTGFSSAMHSMSSSTPSPAVPMQLPQMQTIINFAPEKFVGFQPKTIQLNNLGTSKELIIRNMTGAGLLPMISTSSEVLKFGASFVNGSEVMIDVKINQFSYSTSCDIYSSSAAITDGIKQLLSRI